jgi:hypothetical protein
MCSNEKSENEMFVKVLKECSLEEMVDINEGCYYICRGRIVDKNENFTIGIYNLLKVWRLLGGNGGDYDSIDDEEYDGKMFKEDLQAL